MWFTVLLTLLTACGPVPAPSDAVFITKAPKLEIVKDKDGYLVLAGNLERLFLDRVSDRGRVTGSCRITFSDNTYACPSRNYLLKTFGPWFITTLEGIGCRKYSSTNDCDKFAMAYRLLTCFAHLREETKAQSPAVGIIWYINKGNTSISSLI